MKLLSKSSLFDDGAQQTEETEHEEAGAEERFFGGSRLSSTCESFLREAVGSWSQKGLRWETDLLQGWKHTAHQVFVQLHDLSLQTHVERRSSSTSNHNKANSNWLTWITQPCFIVHSFEVQHFYFSFRTRMMFHIWAVTFSHKSLIQSFTLSGDNGTDPRKLSTCSTKRK